MSPRDAVGEISPELGAIRQVRRRPKLAWSMRIGGAVLIFYVAVALISLVWTPYDPLTPGIGDGYDAPSWTFPLGPAPLGADMMSRLMVGARYNLGITLTAVAIAFCVGTTIGVIAGYYGGAIDTVALRAVEIFQAFPGLLFAMLAGLVLDSTTPGVLALLLVGIPISCARRARIIRGAAGNMPRPPAWSATRRGGGLPPSAAQQRRALLAFTSINAAFVALRQPGLPGPWPRSEHAGMGQHDRPRPGRDDRAVVGLVLPGSGDPGLTGAFYLLGDAISDLTDPRRRR
jgi:peptide/nickel transport system permease protein